MTTAVKAIYEHGVFKPLSPLRLKEATEVEVLVPMDEADAADDPSGWKAMREFIGLARDSAAGNASVDHDAVIYRR